MPPMIKQQPQGPPVKFPTLPEIKNKLPGDCFRSSLITSVYYVIRSASFVTALFLAVYLICSPDSQFYAENENIRVCNS